MRNLNNQNKKFIKNSRTHLRSCHLFSETYNAGLKKNKETYNAQYFIYYIKNYLDNFILYLISNT